MLQYMSLVRIAAAITFGWLPFPMACAQMLVHLPIKQSVVGKDQFLDTDNAGDCNLGTRILDLNIKCFWHVNVPLLPWLLGSSDVFFYLSSLVVPSITH